MNSSDSTGGQNSHLKQNMQDPDESIKDHTNTPHRMSAKINCHDPHIFLLCTDIEEEKTVK